MASTSKHPLILFSERLEDERFAFAVAARLGTSFLHHKKLDRGIAALLEHEKKVPLVFVDASTESQLKNFLGALSLARGSDAPPFNPNYLHYFGDRGLDENTFIARAPLFGTYLQRHYGSTDIGAHTIFARYLEATRAKKSFGLKSFLAPDVQVKTIALAESDKRTVVIEAVQKAALAGGFKDRLSNRIAMAVDELLMNAIFDAPIDEAGNRSRQLAPRSDAFSLSGRSAVEFSLAFDGDTLGVLVADKYGSLDKAKFLSHVARINPQGPNGFTIDDTAGAGLGLAAIYQTGCDMYFSCTRGSLTEVALFFKATPRTRDARSEFRFLGTRFS